MVECENIVIGPIVLDTVFETQKNVLCQKTQPVGPMPLDRSFFQNVRLCMAAYETRLDIVRGMYKQFVFQLEDSADISKCKDIVMTIKEVPIDPDTDIVFQKSFDSEESDLTTGKIVFTFDPEDTRDKDMKSYWYDVQIDIDNKQIYQVSIGNFVIGRNVWHRI